MKKSILTLSILFVCLIGLFFFKPNSLVYSQSSSELMLRQIYRRLEEELNKLPEDAGYLIVLRGRTFEKNSDKQFSSFFNNSKLATPLGAVNFMNDLIHSNQGVSESDPDPFKPSLVLPAESAFVGKGGISGEGRSEIGSLKDNVGNGVFFAIFIPSGGANSAAIISNLEQLMYNPSADPAAATTSTSTATPSQASATRLTGPVKGSRLCIKIGAPTKPMPPECAITTFTIGGTSAGAAPTVEAGKLVETIKNEFEVSMAGAWDEKHLNWIYEKFYALKQDTKFIDYIRGQPIILTTEIPNQESGFVKMSQTDAYANDKDYFLGTLIHEFGHVIYHNALGKNLRGEVDNLYSQTQIGCVSSYSRCQADKTENYPEVIAYCLNNKAVGATIDPGKWAQYREIAVKILGFCYN